MIKFDSKNRLYELINNIKKSEIYYDTNRFIIFVYSDNATEEERRKMQLAFLNYVDLSNLQPAYNKMVIYS